MGSASVPPSMARAWSPAPKIKGHRSPAFLRAPAAPQPSSPTLPTFPHSALTVSPVCRRLREPTNGKKVFPWRKSKKHDDDFMSSLVKLRNPRNRAAVHVPVAWALHKSGTPCAGWEDVHLSEGWLLSHRRVHMPPVP
jgi:hypothetical protein